MNNTIESIFYSNQRVLYYELFTHTLKGESRKVHTIYEVEWHTIKCTIRDEITKEEYEILLKGLTENGNNN